MNFQTLNTAREKQYVQLTAVDFTAYSSPSPRQWPSGDISYETECTCTDGPGQTQVVIATSKFPDPVFDENDINRPMDWKMKWFNSKEGVKISGYPLKPKQHGEQRQQQPGSFQQAPQQPNFNPARQPQPAAPAGGAIPFTPPQQTYTPINQPKPRDYDKENRGKCRLKLYEAHIQGGISAVQLGGDFPLLKAIETLVGYAMCGLPAHDEDGLLPDFVANAGQSFAQNNPIESSGPTDGHDRNY